MPRPTICIDFDGVIHDYMHGWQDGSIYGGVVPGFFEWAAEAHQTFDLVIYSSRSSDPEQLEAMSDWLDMHMDEWGRSRQDAGLDTPDMPCFEYAAVKPPAWLTIDDRCIRFDGDWGADALRPQYLHLFKPWNQK